MCADQEKDQNVIWSFFDDARGHMVRIKDKPSAASDDERATL